MAINVTNPIVEEDRRPTRAFALFLNGIGPVVNVSANVASLSAAVSANTASIATLSATVSGHTSSIATLSTSIATVSGQARDAQLMAAWVVPWP
jgi:hypothetical protein